MGRSLGVLMILMVGAAVPKAAAHVELYVVSDVDFDPANQDHVIATAAWGLLETFDGGETWTWSCAQAMGFDAFIEFPALQVLEDGSMLLGSGFNGLQRSTPDGCGWGRAGGPPEDGFVIDMTAQPADPSTVWLAVTSGLVPDRILRTDDSGRSFVDEAVFADGFLERIVVSADGSRRYASGFQQAGDGRRTGWFLRADDDGPWVDAPFVLLEGERMLRVLAVDPGDPDRLWAQTVRRISDLENERLLRSEDGGRSWETVFEAHEVSGFALSPDGRTAYAGSQEPLREGSLFRSTDGGESFSPLVADWSVRAIATRNDEVWVAVQEVGLTFRLERSLDGGESFETVLDLDRLGPPTDRCDACTEVGGLCPAFVPLISARLAQRSDYPGPEEPLTLPPPDVLLPPECFVDEPTPAGSCGCRAGAPNGPRGGGVIALGLATLLLARRRRRA